MVITRSLADAALLPDAHRPSVVTIGNFDGVHCGHQAVIAEVRKRANECDARSVVVTFDPHPSHVLQGEDAPPAQLITPLPEKLRLLEKTGIDHVLLLPFNDDLRTLTAQQFAQNVLCDGLRTVEIHEGETFRFGHRAEADMQSLEALGQQLCFRVSAYTPVRRRGGPVSSSRIRALVQKGKVETARSLLRRPFALHSTPARGRGYGTRYAVPTINLTTPTGLLPGNGVYVTTLRIGSGAGSELFEGVTNAGNRPTFGEDSYAIETHLFGFRPVDLTEDTPLELRFLHKLRDERRFASPDELVRQIRGDVSRAQRYFALCRGLAKA